MNSCKRCGVAINDETTICLFCGMVLSGDGSGTGNIYPDIRNKTRMLKRLINIASYFAVVLEIFLVVINYYNYYGIKWSIITGGAIFYIILTLQYSVNILICMVINFENWQSYLLMQIFTLVMSIIHMVFYMTGIIKNGPLLPWVTFGVSAVIFT